MDSVRNYFPEFSAIQHEMLDRLTPLYEDWNSKINVISRKDMAHFRERHVLHSLAIYKTIQFPEGSISVELRDEKRAQKLRENFRKIPPLNFDN